MYTLIRKGVAHSLGGALAISETPSGTPERVDFSPFDGKTVVFAVYHAPELSEAALPGLGSCLWEPVGRCPAGHAERADPILWFGEGVGRVRHDGTFSVVGSTWPETRLLENHRVVMAVARRFGDDRTPFPEAAGEIQRQLREMYELSAQLSALKNEFRR